MTGNDTSLLVVTSSVTGQLKNFSGQVFENRSQVDWGSGTDSLSIISLAKKTMDSTNGELKSSTRRTSFGLGLRLSTFFCIIDFLPPDYKQSADIIPSKNKNPVTN